MTKDLRLIRVCDHIVRSTYEVLIPNSLVVRSSSSNIDYIYNDNIKRIDQVCYIDLNCDIIVYIQDVDYILYSGDKIKWISTNKPPNGVEYMVSYIVDSTSTIQYDFDKCPKCNSVGWYLQSIDIIGNDISEITGIYKLVQNVIKIILTDKDETGYGTNIGSYIGKEEYTEGELIKLVSDEIVYAQNKYISYQKELETKGVELSTSERLRAIVISSTNFDQETLSLYIDLIVYNYEDSNAQVTINL